MTDDTKKRALKILERRDMSVREMTDKLIAKGETPEAAAECAGWLVDLGFLNDERFAGILARHYAAKGCGAARIKNEFYRRGLARELWDDALSELPETDDALDALVASRLRGKEPDRDALRKCSAALQRRGYGWDEINAAIQRYTENEE